MSKLCQLHIQILLIIGKPFHTTTFIAYICKKIGIIIFDSIQKSYHLALTLTCKYQCKWNKPLDETNSRHSQTETKFPPNIVQFALKNDGFHTKSRKGRFNVLIWLIKKIASKFRLFSSRTRRYLTKQTYLNLESVYFHY